MSEDAGKANCEIKMLITQQFKTNKKKTKFSFSWTKLKTDHNRTRDKTIELKRQSGSSLKLKVFNKNKSPLSGAN